MLTNAASFSLRKEKGLTLIEVLVTAMILSIGLLGLAGMHFHGLKNNQSAYFRSQATILGYAILDAMRANKASALSGNYAVQTTEASDDSTTSDGAGTSNKTLAELDVDDWTNKLGSALPSGTGTILCTETTAVCKVTVTWNDDIGEGGSTEQAFIVTTQL